MAKLDNRAGGKRPIVIRREEIVEGGHHGGAWKVAYADFVTAMMAFFLLMWLLNATTSEQRRGLADYFSPTNLMSRTTSGFGAPFGGHTVNDDGALASDRGAVQVMNADARPAFDVEDDDGDTPATAAAVGGRKGDVPTRLKQVRGADPQSVTVIAPGDVPPSARVSGPEPGPVSQPPSPEQRQAQAEREVFDRAARQLRDAVAKDSALADVARQLSVDVTPEGLRIQILDADKQAMFPTGSADLTERARALLMKVAPVLMKLPEPISITGHTDAAQYRGGERTNWELSADRANATRRLFAEAGLPEARVVSVSGRSDRDPLLPAAPFAAANRRIAIVVLHAASSTAQP